MHQNSGEFCEVVLGILEAIPSTVERTERLMCMKSPLRRGDRIPRLIANRAGSVTTDVLAKVLSSLMTGALGL